MTDSIWNIMMMIGQFIQEHWSSIVWMMIALYLIHIMRKSNEAKNFILEQFNWVKGFFYDDDEVVGSPNHKNLILFALVAVFSIAYLKKVVSATDIPDIPGGWQLVLLAGLGINQAKSAAQKLFENKWGQAKDPNAVDTSVKVENK